MEIDVIKMVLEKGILRLAFEDENGNITIIINEEVNSNAKIKTRKTY